MSMFRFNTPAAIFGLHTSNTVQFRSNGTPLAFIFAFKSIVLIKPKSNSRHTASTDPHTSLKAREVDFLMIVGAVAGVEFMAKEE